MNWTRPIGTLAVFVVAISVIGALLTLATRLPSASYIIPATLVLILVAASVAASVRVGALSSRSLSNPYW